MEWAAGLVVFASLFERNTRVDKVYNIDAGDQVVDELAGYLAFHALSPNRFAAHTCRRWL